jgi:hypothetical protein
MKNILITLLLFLTLSCTKDVQPLITVTTSYDGVTLKGTVNSRDSLVRGFVISVYDGKQLNVGTPTSEYGVGNFGMKPILNPTTVYYIWAFAYKIGNENNVAIGNTIILNN